MITRRKEEGEKKKSAFTLLFAPITSHTRARARRQSLISEDFRLGSEAGTVLVDKFTSESFYFFPSGFFCFGLYDFVTAIEIGKTVKNL